MRHSNAKEAF